MDVALDYTTGLLGTYQVHQTLKNIWWNSSRGTEQSINYSLVCALRGTTRRGKSTGNRSPFLCKGAMPEGIVSAWLLLTGKHVCKYKGTALAGVAQWTECQPVGQKAAGFIPSGHKSGSWAGSPGEGVWEATDHCFSHVSCFISLALSPSFPLSQKNK